MLQKLSTTQKFNQIEQSVLTTVTMKTNDTQQSPIDDIRKENIESSPSENSGATDIPTLAYPSSWRQAVIITGLLLGIFLVSSPLFAFSYAILLVLTFSVSLRPASIS